MSDIVNAVEIVFENLDFVRIPVEHIGEINMQDVSYSIGYYCTNTLKKHLHSKYVYVQVMKSFKCDFSKQDEFTDLCEDFEVRIFNPDITYFRIHYNDGTYEDIYVSWEDCEDDEYSNRLQRTFRDEEGNIVIEIGQE